ncbi:MAG TPA: hypothetical protein VHR43_13630 [Gemmatimonadales bacterium]|jgi:hypothetical protein|nr:hypothetical protein [Gemmatimonadales bacterium]
MNVTGAFGVGAGRVGRGAMTAALAAALALAWPSAAQAQGAIDPNVAPRAAALEREGERQMAIDLLGHYLATAPDDGGAWFQLGRFYLFDERDWHLHGHRGDPDGLLYLEFAATALDQAVRLSVDSGVVFRGITDMDRSLILVEDSGWAAARATLPRPAAVAPMPAYIVELGTNLLTSCPAGGVLLTGSELEAVSVWYGSLEHAPADILPIRPDLYATDSLYRQRMAAAMGVDPALPVQRALAAVAANRTVCLSPGTDLAAAPALAWTPFRMARISRTAPSGPEALSVAELLKATRQLRSPWVADVRRVYAAAARYNSLLCGSLLLYLDDAAPAGCGP